MTKVAIVSSYDEECGAAFFSSRLKIHLEKSGLQVDVLRLPVSLLRVNNPRNVRMKGHAEVSRIAARLKDYDAVYMQFEPGLYGSTHKTSYIRAMRLLKAARKVVLTIHGFDRVAGSLSAVEAMMAGDFRRAFLTAIDVGRDATINRFWHGVRAMPHVEVIAFCKADQILLERLYGLTRVTHYPITYFDKEQADALRATVDRDKLLAQYGLDPKKKYFGVCGFLAPYKGHLTAIKALEFLPDDWNLVIVGGEHPQALEPDRDIGAYVRQILAFTLESDDKSDNPVSVTQKSRTGDLVAQTDMDRIELKETVFKRSEFKYFFPEESVRERVKFVGQVSDDEMPRFYYALDYVVHPYMRTRSGQSGSGPATMAVEFGSRALFSNAPVFREMERYFKGGMAFFNIGNFVELAESLQRLDNFWDDISAARDKSLETYNPAGMVALYRQRAGI